MLMTNNTPRKVINDMMYDLRIKKYPPKDISSMNLRRIEKFEEKKKERNKWDETPCNIDVVWNTGCEVIPSFNDKFNLEM